MKKPRPTRPKAIKDRAVQTAQVTQPASTLAAEAAPRRAFFNPLKFFEEVNAERRKITWTSRNETWITSVMVFIMIAITATFFVLLDLVLSAGMDAFLKFSAGG